MRQRRRTRRPKGRSQRWVGLSIVFSLLVTMELVALGPVLGAAAATPRPHQAMNPPSLYQPVAFGSAPNLGTLDITGGYDFPVVGLAGTSDGQGLWLVGRMVGSSLSVVLGSMAQPARCTSISPSQVWR